MKYMGSKRAMLSNGLGALLDELTPKKKRFFDLFCGAGSVSSYISTKFNAPVYASDLQEYAVAITRVQVEQVQPFSGSELVGQWENAARGWIQKNKKIQEEAKTFDLTHLTSASSIYDAVMKSRNFCAAIPDTFPLSKAYGGYYFSPEQSITLDALRATLPKGNIAAIAALLDAASSCAASPGHTAQPFSPTPGSIPYLKEAWRRNLGARVAATIGLLSRHAARQPGVAYKNDAISATSLMESGDIAFIDPPYSEVQYSRFYHVLESIAVGDVSAVNGSGRYPSILERPQSKFCRKTKSKEEFDSLMLSIALTGAEAIVTFPAGEASNGLSGSIVEALSCQYFKVNKREISGSFSTLGGNSKHRHARQKATELILHLTPR